MADNITQPLLIGQRLDHHLSHGPGFFSSPSTCLPQVLGDGCCDDIQLVLFLIIRLSEFVSDYISYTERWDEDDEDDDADADGELCRCIVSLHILRKWDRLQNCSTTTSH